MSHQRFSYRIRFRLAGSDVLNSTSAQLDVSLPGLQPVIIRPVHSKTLQESNVLEIHSCTVMELNDAWREACLLQTILQVSTLRIRTGVDTGSSPWSGADSEPNDYIDRETSENWDKLGISLFEGPIPKRAGVSGISLSRLHPSDELIEIMKLAAERLPELSPKVKLALEVYSSSHFESTPRAQFLTLFTILEILSNRKRRTKDQRAVLKQAEGVIQQSGLTAPEKESLLCSLRVGRDEFIADARLRLIEETLGPSEAADLERYSRARDHLVHRGKVKPTISFEMYLSGLSHLVWRLLLITIFGSDPFRDIIARYRRSG